MIYSRPFHPLYSDKSVRQLVDAVSQIVGGFEQGLTIVSIFLLIFSSRNA